MIGVSIFNDEVSHDLDEALSLLHSWGQPMFDLRENIFGDTVIDDITDEQRDILAEKLGRYDFAITCIGTRKLVVNPGPPEPAMSALLSRLIETAKRLRVPMIRVCTAAPRPASEAERREMAAGCVDGMRRLAGQAGDAGILLALENKPTSITNSGAEMADFAAKVDHPAFRLVWDAANTWIAGVYDPVGDYEACREFIGTVHLKGCNGENGRYLCGALMGEDDFPHREIIARLVRDGYDGNITLDLATNGMLKQGFPMTRAEIARRSLEAARQMIAEACV